MVAQMIRCPMRRPYLLRVGKDEAVALRNDLDNSAAIDVDLADDVFVVKMACIGVEIGEKVRKFRIR